MSRLKELNLLCGHESYLKMTLCRAKKVPTYVALNNLSSNLIKTMSINNENVIFWIMFKMHRLY